MSGSVAKITSLLEKVSHYDKDERYMAVSDINNELSKDITLDTLLERKLCSSIVERLEKDTSTDVQALAAKTLPLLVKKVSSNQTAEVCERLAHQLLNGREDLKDVFAIGLKTVIAEAEPGVAPQVAKAIATPLLSGLQPSAKPDVVIQSLDVSASLLSKMGPHVASQHAMFLEATLRRLADKGATIRKRAINCIGALAPVISDELLERCVVELLRGIDKKGGATASVVAGADTPTLIQTIGAVSRHVGFRLGKHLAKIVPLLLSCMGDPSDESKHDDVSNELRENCLQAFESFLLRSPKEVSSYVGDILGVTLQFLRYDPNYMGGEDEEDDAGGVEGLEFEEDAEDEDADYDDGDYGDDDDTSWKVRRASAKVIAASIASRPQMIRDLYDQLAVPVLRRFSEREETVRLEVISCITELVKTTNAGATVGDQTIDVDDHTTAALGAGALHNVAHEDDAMSGHAPHPPLQRQDSVTTRLVDALPRVVKSSLILLKENDAKSVRTRTAVLQLLKTLFVTIAHSSSNTSSAALHGYLNYIIPSLLRCLKDARHAHSAAMRLEALSALRVLLVLYSNKVEELSDHLPSIVPQIVHVAKDEWYRLVAEVLRLVAVLATLLRPANGRVLASTPTLPQDVHERFAKQLYDVVQVRLVAHDIDQEIKECAITAAGALIAHVGDVSTIAPHVATVLSILAERLRSEATRLHTLRALSYFALSPVAGNVASTLHSLLPDISSFVRQTSRILRQQALETLRAIASVNPHALSHDVMAATVSNAASAIEEGDLQLAQQALELATSLIPLGKEKTDVEKTLATIVLPKATHLATSPVIQGAALSSLETFFATAVSTFDKTRSAFNFTSLLDAVMREVNARVSKGTTAVSTGFGKQSVMNAARIVGVLCTNAPSEAVGVIKTFIASGTSESADASLALHCLGELGSSTDIFAIDSTAAEKVMAHFKSSNDNLKSAASFALGGMCVGSLSAGLPHILNALSQAASAPASTSANERIFLLLSALREVLLHHFPANPSGPPFGAHVEEILPMLTSPLAASNDEGVRNMVAECIGRTAAIDAERIFPVLHEFAKSDVEGLRWTAVTSFRHAVASSAASSVVSSEKHQSTVASLLKLIEDPSLSVRLAAINAVNLTAYSPAHHVLKDLLAPVPTTRFVAAGTTAAAASAVKPPSFEAEGLLANLYYEMIPRAELVREVNLGPFTHKQDDGLPLRKAAFVTLDTILSSKLAGKVGAEVIPIICSGLRDHDDVKMICHTLLSKMAANPAWQGHIVADLPQIVDAISPALKSPDDKAAVPVDVLRSALRAVDSIARQCSDAASVERFAATLDLCSKEPGIAPIFAQVRSASTEAADAGRA